MVGHHQQQEHLVHLRRDAVTASWGFRLQGGQENNTPLTVQRVFVGGVSDGKLQRGDVVAAIGGQNARGMYHSQAEDIIRGAGHDISFTVLRGGGGGGGDEHEPSFVKNDYSSYQLPWQTSAPAAPAYAPAPAAAAAAAPPWIGGTSEDDADNEQRSFGDLRRQFSKATTVSRAPAPSYIPKRPFIVKRPGQFDGALADPGWVPGSSRAQQSAPKSSRYVPLSPPASAHSSSRPQQQSYPRSHPEIRHEAPEAPAWLGTLRSAGGPRLWEIQEGQSLVGGGARVPAPVRQVDQQSRPVYGSTAPVAGGGGGVQVHSPRVQAARYGPGAAAPTYEQRSAEGVDSDTARVAHLQYNTPIGLYSKDSAREALEGQTRGKAGYGTMQITGTGPTSGPGANKIKPFDPAHSDVYRLVLQEDEIRKSGGVVYGTGEAAPPPQRPRGPNPAAAQGRPSNAPQSQPEEPHSARFYQLVHENDDQAQQFAGVHPEQQYPFGDNGVSDF